MESSDECDNKIVVGGPEVDEGEIAPAAAPSGNAQPKRFRPSRKRDPSSLVPADRGLARYRDKLQQENQPRGCPTSVRDESCGASSVSDKSM